MVWVPSTNFGTFILVDDDGKELARGALLGNLSNNRQRQLNYTIVQGGKYAGLLH
jgi:hypothetical protein